jgi:GT2 family glycosyltransferase
MDWAQAFKLLETPPIWDFMRLKGLPWDVARCHAAYHCMSGRHSETGVPFQWLFFLDSDTICPRDAIIHLMSHRLPIVSGLYYQRFPTWDGLTAQYLPCMFNEAVVNGKATKQPITEFKPGSLVEAAYVPGGCLLIHRSVFERFIQAGIKRIFEWTLTVDAEPIGRSEDFEFCFRARQLGFKCMVDTSIVCEHDTQAKVGPRGLLPKL